MKRNVWITSFFSNTAQGRILMVSANAPLPPQGPELAPTTGVKYGRREIKHRRVVNRPQNID